MQFGYSYWLAVSLAVGVNEIDLGYYYVSDKQMAFLRICLALCFQGEMVDDSGLDEILWGTKDWPPDAV